MLTAELKNNKLVVTIDASIKDLQRSASGKTLIVASSHGNQATTVTVDGKPVVIGLNAYVKA